MEQLTPEDRERLRIAKEKFKNLPQDVIDRLPLLHALTGQLIMECEDEYVAPQTIDDLKEHITKLLED